MTSGVEYSLSLEIKVLWLITDITNTSSGIETFEKATELQLFR